MVVLSCTVGEMFSGPLFKNPMVVNIYRGVFVLTSSLDDDRMIQATYQDVTSF